MCIETNVCVVPVCIIVLYEWVFLSSVECALKANVCVSVPPIGHRMSDGCGLGNCALKYKSVLKVGVSVSVSVAGGGDEGGCWWWGTRLTPLKSGATTPPILGSIPPFVAGRRALSKSFLLLSIKGFLKRFSCS